MTLELIYSVHYVYSFRLMQSLKSAVSLILSTEILGTYITLTQAVRITRIKYAGTKYHVKIRNQDIRP